MKNIERIVDRYFWFFALIGFVGVSLWFNYRLFWSQLLFDSSTIGRVWGEVQVYAWLTDKFYRTLSAGHNPFGLVDGMLYPFQIQVGLTDAGNGLFYPLFRPFFSAYQTFTLILAIGQIMANIGMYLLLRKLKIDKAISFIISLAFAYMTFLGPREGHMNYWVIYVFPWFYLSGLYLFTATNMKQKLFASIASAFFFSLSLWVNFYYFVMICISITALILYFLIFNRPALIITAKKYWQQFVLTVVIGLVILTPWIIGLYERLKFEELPELSGWGGAVQYSADLFSFFIPGLYNHYIYNYFPQLYETLVKTYAPFAASAFENFVYPGIIIIGSYIAYLVLARRKDFTETFKKSAPYLFVSFVFFVFTLGPFLHVFGRWGFTLGEGVRLVVPLPYVLLHYTPLLENIRVPGRLIVGFIFFAYIVSAFTLEYFLKSKSGKFRMTLLVILSAIFLFDQRYVDYLKPPTKEYPYKIFTEIKKDPSHASVLEIPFVVRDGFTYFGDQDAVFGIVGEAYYEKPILAGYTGRISDYIRAYYIRNPFFGYIGRLIDQDLDTNPIVDKSQLSQWQRLDIQKSRDVLDFLDAKYIIADATKPYMATLSADLMKLKFSHIANDGSFGLYVRPPEKREFLTIDMSDPSSVTYLGMGWHVLEDDSRWSGKKSFVMFKIYKQRKFNIKLKVRGFKDGQVANIYLNKKKVGKVSLSDKMEEHNVLINAEFRKGLNSVYFIFDRSYIPSAEIPNNQDNRELTAQFAAISLEEVN